MIRVQTWHGSATVRVTEMENAGKRGKACRVFRFLGWLPYSPATEQARLTYDVTLQVLHYADSIRPSDDFDAVKAHITDMVKCAGLPDHLLTTAEETCRGVDAPKEVLTAGIKDVWSASIDENGVSVSDLVDQYNLPCAITHKQSKAEAYRLARRVWDRVRECRSFSEATDVLCAAGCRLHYFCSMD